MISTSSKEYTSCFGKSLRYVSLKCLNFCLSSDVDKCHSPTIFFTFFLIQERFSSLKISYSPPSQSVFIKSILSILFFSIKDLKVIVSTSWIFSFSQVSINCSLNSPVRRSVPSTLPIALFIRIVFFEKTFLCKLSNNSLCGSKQYTFSGLFSSIENVNGPTLAPISKTISPLSTLKNFSFP